MVDENVPAPNPSEQVRGALAHERPSRPRHPWLVLQIWPVDCRELHQCGEAKGGVADIDPFGSDLELSPERVDELLRRVAADLDANDVSGSPLDELCLDC